MTIAYPRLSITNELLCDLFAFHLIEAKEYTDCAILYEVTFDQLRALVCQGIELGKKDQRESDEQICLDYIDDDTLGCASAIRNNTGDLT